MRARHPGMTTLETAVPRRRMRWWERLMEPIAASRPGAWLYVHVFCRIDPPLLRLTGGRVSVSLGWPILLLTHTGARSGARRRTALLYTADGDRIVLVASKGGAARNPAWYHNLRANPRCSVLAPGRGGEYVARVVEDGAERERLWALATDLYAGYTAYQGRTERRIPVLVLEPRPS
jgi:deazaflavin-dependent oxidoreductase (nitroreductase family)